MSLNIDKKKNSIITITENVLFTLIVFFILVLPFNRTKQNSINCVKIFLTDFKELFMFSPGTWKNAIIHSIFQHVSLNGGTPVYPGV